MLSGETQALVTLPPPPQGLHSAITLSHPSLVTFQVSSQDLRDNGQMVPGWVTQK